MWHPGLDIEVSASQVLVLIVVPIITVGLWWLLGHTAFGDAVRASATNVDLARMTGISPKLVSTAVWTIAGFLSAVAVFLTASDQGSTDLVHIGPDTLLRGMAAALIGGMVSFPRAALGAILIGIFDRVLFFNYTTETGLVQFVLFLVVLVLVARVSKRDAEAAGESFQFAPRISAVPERLKGIWWVRRLPQLVAGLALVAAIVVPLLSDKSERHQTWTTIVAFALCAVSDRRADGLGRSAFARADGVRRARRVDRGRRVARGLSVDIGWHNTRILRGSLPAIGFPWSMLVGACVACLIAVFVGVGALRVRGLLLAISTLALAIASQVYLFDRPFFTAGRSTVQIPRADIGPFELTHKNRGLLLLHPLRARGRAAPRRPPPPHRGRPDDRRRARERARGRGDDGLAGACEADRVRGRRVHRRARRRAARRGEPRRSGRRSGTSSSRTRSGSSRWR